MVGCGHEIALVISPRRMGPIARVAQHVAAQRDERRGRLRMQARELPFDLRIGRGAPQGLLRHLEDDVKRAVVAADVRTRRIERGRYAQLAPMRARTREFEGLP